MTKAAITRLVCMCVLNIVGVIAYLLFATQGWVEPEVADIPGASGGGALLWGLTALPTLLAFIVIDAVWLIFECVIYAIRKPWRLSLVLISVPALIVPLMWAVAVHIDYSHHGV